MTAKNSNASGDAEPLGRVIFGMAQRLGIDAGDRDALSGPDLVHLLDRIEQKLRDASMAAAVPDGFKLVPIEPTPAMLAAGSHGRVIQAYVGAQEKADIALTRRYQAMVDAAPPSYTTAEATLSCSDTLIPGTPDLNYLRGIADSSNLPSLLRGNIAAALRWVDLLQTRLANPQPAQPMLNWMQQWPGLSANELVRMRAAWQAGFHAGLGAETPELSNAGGNRLHEFNLLLSDYGIACMADAKDGGYRHGDARLKLKQFVETFLPAAATLDVQSEVPKNVDNDMRQVKPTVAAMDQLAAQAGIPTYSRLQSILNQRRQHSGDAQGHEQAALKDLQDMWDVCHKAKYHPSLMRRCSTALSTIEAALSRQSSPEAVAAQVWEAAQLVPGECIEDGIHRIQQLLTPSAPASAAQQEHAQ